VPHRAQWCRRNLSVTRYARLIVTVAGLERVPSGSVDRPLREEIADMARHDSERPMTDAQRDEIKRLCHEAEIPDKSGELYTERTGQALIEDLREKATTVSRSQGLVHRHQ
jgi:hypothetical protein